MTSINGKKINYLNLHELGCSKKNDLICQVLSRFFNFADFMFVMIKIFIILNFKNEYLFS